MIKKLKPILATLIILSCSASIRSGELIDFGTFTHKLAGVKPIDHFIGEKGEKVTVSRRNAALYEVKLEITADKGGEFALSPRLFAALYTYRKTAQLSPAAALGTKVKDKESGETKEYWYNAPEVSVIIEVEKGEKFYRYIIVELPKEVKQFRLIGPSELALVEV